MQIQKFIICEGTHCIKISIKWIFSDPHFSIKEQKQLKDSITESLNFECISRGRFKMQRKFSKTIFMDPYSFIDQA